MAGCWRSFCRTERQTCSTGEEKLPFAGNSLQPVRSVAVEGQARAGNQVLYCSRDQYFPRLRTGHYPRTDMYRDTADCAIEEFAFARVQAHAYFDSQRAHDVPDCQRATYAARRPVECSHEAIAGGVDFLPPEPLQRLPFQSLSPTRAACSVEPTMSVNRTVARIRS